MIVKLGGGLQLKFLWPGSSSAPDPLDDAIGLLLRLMLTYPLGIYTFIACTAV